MCISQEGGRFSNNLGTILARNLSWELLKIGLLKLSCVPHDWHCYSEADITASKATHLKWSFGLVSIALVTVDIEMVYVASCVQYMCDI